VKTWIPFSLNRSRGRGSTLPKDDVEINTLGTVMGSSLLGSTAKEDIGTDLAPLPGFSLLLGPEEAVDPGIDLEAGVPGEKAAEVGLVLVLVVVADRFFGVTGSVVGIGQVTSGVKTKAGDVNP